MNRPVNLCEAAVGPGSVGHRETRHADSFSVCQTGPSRQTTFPMQAQGHSALPGMNRTNCGLSAVVARDKPHTLRLNPGKSGMNRLRFNHC